ncbi:hypothetical protein SAY86_019470 [Trapa natans]|uniref:Uncharacterized protein n=1 Tax=Trapa natans TaxID=22666 RepID=A0AAN7M0J4_TRANT|nr:hypothetical protein SAY86_019470 [Trapa natans]
MVVGLLPIQVPLRPFKFAGHLRPEGRLLVGGISCEMEEGRDLLGAHVWERSHAILAVAMGPGRKPMDLGPWRTDLRSDGRVLAALARAGSWIPGLKCSFLDKRIIVTNPLHSLTSQVILVRPRRVLSLLL